MPHHHNYVKDDPVIKNCDLSYLISPTDLRTDLQRAVRMAKSRYFNYKRNHQLGVYKRTSLGINDELKASIDSRKDQIFTKALSSVYDFLVKRCSRSYKKLLINPETLVDSVSEGILKTKIAEACNILDETSNSTPKIMSLDERYIVDALTGLFLNWFGDYGTCIRPSIPTFNDILSGIKKEANMGASRFISKLRPKAYCMDILERGLIRNFILNDAEYRFSLSELPILIFTRLQFKVTEIKTRLVFAVPGEVAILESTLLNIVRSCIRKDNSNLSYCSGLTQLGVRDAIVSLYGKLKGSLDANKFDLRIHGYLLCLPFTVLECTIFKNSPILLETSRFLCWYSVNGACYHKDFGIINRCGGLMSGSGFTNFFGTFITALNSYLVDEIQNFFDIQSIRASGDDLALSFLNVTIPNPLEVFINLSKEMTGIIYSDESFLTQASNNTVEFLGSTWIDGLPKRNVQQLLNSLVVSLKQNSIHNHAAERNPNDYVIAVLYETGRYHSSLQSVYQNLGFKQSDYVDKSINVYTLSPDYREGVARGVRIPRNVNLAWMEC